MNLLTVLGYGLNVALTYFFEKLIVVWIDEHKMILLFSLQLFMYLLFFDEECLIDFFSQD